MNTALPLDRLSRLDNFGHSLQSTAFLYRPTRVEQIDEILRLARLHGLSIALRGSGRSYGDGALNSGQIVLDLTRMNRILDWNPETGVIRAEPGVTIQQLWQYVLEDGWWPRVVSGTMFPTLGGALGMNIHGKNNYRAGTIGEQVLEFTALLPTGEEVTCTPTQNPDLFYALISSAGLLGIFTSITMQMKRIYSGNVKVHAWAVGDIREMLADLDRLKQDHSYLVGWVDGFATGRATGRGQIHTADYPEAGEDPLAARTLRLEHQTLPDSFFGLVPKSSLWFFMQFFMNNLGTALINTAKYAHSRTLDHHQHYVQSLVAFNFLLDYVTGWERSYGREGLIQYQSFVPLQTAGGTYAELLRLAQKRGLPTYLGVTKRHRPDRFLFTHAVDGYSLAMDLKVTHDNRTRLQALANELNEIVLAAGGRFYFAKDSTLTPAHAARYLGAETLQRFRALKEHCDPDHLLQTDLYRRVLLPLVTTP